MKLYNIPLTIFFACLSGATSIAGSLPVDNSLVREARVFTQANVIYEDHSQSPTHQEHAQLSSSHEKFSAPAVGIQAMTTKIN